MVIAVVADDVAGDALDASIGQRRDEGFEGLEDVVAVKPRVDGGVTAAIDDQIALEHAGFAGALSGIQGSSDAIFRAEPVESQRHGVELGIGGRAEQLLRVVLEEGFAGIERDDFYAPHCGGKTRL